MIFFGICTFLLKKLNRPRKVILILNGNIMADARKRFGGIHSVFVDGVADAADDVNDPAESNAFVAELHGLEHFHKTYSFTERGRIWQVGGMKAISLPVRERILRLVTGRFKTSQPGSNQNRPL